MKDSLIIGLTGGIASGKSTVCKFFSNLSIPIIDADQISHDLTKINGLAYSEIIDNHWLNWRNCFRQKYCV